MKRVAMKFDPPNRGCSYVFIPKWIYEWGWGVKKETGHLKLYTFLRTLALAPTRASMGTAANLGSHEATGGRQCAFSSAKRTI
eukprot:scaffold260568_cov32-Tisochrysis_lutea.AAC.1